MSLYWVIFLISTPIFALGAPFAILVIPMWPRLQTVLYLILLVPMMYTLFAIIGFITDVLLP